jgi:hypothetical protein
MIIPTKIKSTTSKVVKSKMVFVQSSHSPWFSNGLKNNECTIREVVRIIPIIEHVIGKKKSLMIL